MEFNAEFAQGYFATFKAAQEAIITILNKSIATYFRLSIFDEISVKSSGNVFSEPFS